MKFTDKVSGTIEKNGLISNGDSLLAALSGGPDSVALLSVLVKLRLKLKLQVRAVYINHQIRPSAAKKEEKFCSELCGKLKVPFITVSENIPQLAKKLKKGVEETGRDFRYEKLNLLADELGCNKIALGHHKDDRVETILFRILRGTGRTGLKGIPIERGKIIRPLYDVTKDEIVQYMSKNKINYCVDQSNASVEYTRNFIRHRLLPMIRKGVNSNVGNALLNLSETMAPEEEFLESIVDDAYKECVSHTPAGKLVVALDRFNGYDLWVQRGLIRRCIAKVSGLHSFPDKVTVERILEVAKGNKKAVSVTPNVQCRRAKNELYIFNRKKPAFSAKMNIPGKTSIESVGIQIESKILKVIPASIQRNRRSQNVIVDFKKISGKLVVRNIKIGDRFQPLGMSGTKKVGDYLTDRKVEVVLRDEIPVVVDSKGVVWLAGFEIDDRVKVNGDTKEALEIELNYNN